MKNKNKTAGKTAEQITEEFFRRRFPDKYIYFEIQCGYFGEWVERFKSGKPEAYMDLESRKVWQEMQGGNWTEDPEVEFECVKCGTNWKLGDSVSCPKCDPEEEE